MSDLPAKALVVQNLSVATPEGKILLRDISFSVDEGSFTAIIGLSGCGKSTLIRALAAKAPMVSGGVWFSGHAVNDLRESFPLAIGYIAQFGVFHDDLRVDEILQYAAALRLSRRVSEEARSAWVRRIVEVAKLESLLSQPYKTLSGGQMRRVALAEQLIGDPPFLLLDELTSGLDLVADREIMVWLAELARHLKKTILLVTHNTDHLDMCDNVLLLHEGRTRRFGDYETLLGEQPSVEGFLLDAIASQTSEILSSEQPPSPRPLKTDHPPGFLTQLAVLTSRQAVLFFRDRVQLGIQLSLIITFPVLVAVFALSGLPQVRALDVLPQANLIGSMQDRHLLLVDTLSTASLVSGLIMFQVVLLTLLGANNGAREIAKEKHILAKEIFSGLSPAACVMSKFFQLIFLCAIQAFWMCWFVKTICGFPGTLPSQFLILFLCTLAMSCTCLAISAGSSTAERASLLSIYLVGFQLPLSGAALALPDWLANLSQPVISAYWGWSGFLRTLESSRYFQIVEETTKTPIAHFLPASMALVAHIVLPLTLAIVLLGREKRLGFR